MPRTKSSARYCRSAKCRTESISLVTATKAGRTIAVREMRPGDGAAVHRCMAHPAFRLPYLTGTPDPKNQPVRSWVRSTAYVVKAMASRYFGRIAFGARRHWIMAIADADSGQFIGIVLLDGVARFPRGEAHGLLQRAFIEPHKNKA